jgi:hypothetical protein
MKILTFTTPWRREIFTNEEKNRSTTSGLSRHGGEELELAGVALVNGSGGRRKKDVRALYCPQPLVPAGVTGRD